MGFFSFIKNLFSSKQGLSVKTSTSDTYNKNMMLV